MTDQPDYRKYLEEKFSGFHSLMDAQFILVNDKLERIEEQTKKTNGRTNTLEEKVRVIEGCMQSDKVGKDALVLKKNLRWSRSLSIATVVIGLFMAYLGYRNLTKQNAMLEERVNNLGDPIIINNRGETVALPDGYKLGMWPNDFDEQTKDTVQ